jgi:hypothetical protein
MRDSNPRGLAPNPLSNFASRHSGSSKTAFNASKPEVSDADEANGQRTHSHEIEPQVGPSATTSRSDHTVINSAEPANTLETPTTPPLRYSAKHHQPIQRHKPNIVTVQQGRKEAIESVTLGPPFEVRRRLQCCCAILRSGPFSYWGLASRHLPMKLCP